jgi:hypothetical protein
LAAEAQSGQKTQWVRTERGAGMPVYRACHSTSWLSKYVASCAYVIVAVGQEPTTGWSATSKPWLV